MSSLSSHAEVSCRAVAGRSFERFLDVGCNDGRVTRALQEAADVGEVWGVDVAGSVREARAKGINAVRVDVADGGLPFRDGVFDGVYAGEIICYLPDQDAFFREVRRVLRPDGTFVLSTANLASLHNRLALLLGRPPFPLAHDSLVEESETRSPQPSRRGFTLTHRSTLTYLSRWGFDVRDVSGARATLPYIPFRTAVGAMDSLVSRVPPIAYRNVYTCRKTSPVPARG